ncbi:MAG: ABC transporter permease [Prevotellaceae bacterium]|nr:ABC transporter permease [Prevotellaceae bacterium]
MQILKSCKLSWRNIWRNRRRAIITISSVFFAVFFCSIMVSYQQGMWDKMIDNTLRTQSGHIQIHGTGYWEDKTVDNFLTMDSSTVQRIGKLENVENVSPRVETFALSSFGNISKGVAIVGISPSDEAKKSNLNSHIIKGRYLSENDNGIIIGEGLANYLKAAVGDTLALIGQGHFGASASGLFAVRGIFQIAIGDINNSLIYTSLQSAQKFIDMPDGYSGILVTLKNDKKINESKTEIQTQLSENCEVYDWHFTMQRLLQQSESDQAFGKILLFILYLIVGFGILGTVIMLTNERQREFRTMISLGMQRGKLALGITLELLIMTLIGVLAGLAVSFPAALYFNINPIAISGEMAKMFLDYGMEPLMPTSVDKWIFLKQIFAALAITALAAIYPVWKIKKLRLMEK